MVTMGNGGRRTGGRIARTVLLVLALVGGAALGLFAPAGGRGGQTALACGFVSPQVMLANNSPSLFYPVTQNTPADQPVGLFALNYAVGQHIAFVEDLSRVPNLPANVALRWSFGDGSTYTYGSAPHHTYAAAGVYNVHVQIVDPTAQGGGSDIDSAQITVAAAPVANPPVAKVTESASAVNIHGMITFDAAGSHAADGSQLTYLWNFNDGKTATGAHVTHQFDLQAESIVALIVTDKRGGRSVATTSVVVAPELSASATSVGPGDTVSFDVSAYVPPPGQGPSVSSFTWNFGDGSAEQTTPTPTVTHAYATGGTFMVTVRAGTSKSAQVLALTTVKVLLAAAAVGPTSASPRGPNWALIVAAIVAALVLGGGGIFGVRAQLRRSALIRQRRAALELARERAVRGGRPSGRSGTRDPRAAAGGPPPPARYPEKRDGPRPSRGDPPPGGTR